MAAATSEPLAAGQRAALEGTDKQARLTALLAGFLVGDLTAYGDDRGGVGEPELLRCNGGELQLAVFGPTVVAVVREKRGAVPANACAAAARTTAALSLSWIRYSPPDATIVWAVS